MKRVLILFLVSITSLTFAQNSILFDASDQQYLTISNVDDRFNATADFTYEVWVKFTSKGFNGQRLAPFFGGQQHDYAALIDNRIGMRLNSNGVCSGDRTFGNTSTIDTDTWYHIAYVRSGSVVSLYLDGTLLGTTECAQEDGSVKGVWMINANTINIGAIFWNTSYLDGYIGGMRYVVGTALYSEDFTPQLRWEKTNETILLMNIKNEGAAFTDESDYSNTITLNGSSSTPTFVAGNGPTLPADILFSGDLSIENNSIKNVADPVYAQDAATKSYVDNNVNSFSGSYNDLTDQPSLRDLTGDNPVIFGSLSAFGGTYNNRAILDLVANTEGNLITGYKNGSSGDRFNVKLDNTNENAVVSSGGGYNLKLYSEGGTMEFEGDDMMSTPSFTFNGAVTATSFAGDGSQLTNLPTSDVSYNDLTDKPTTYTQAQVDALIQNLQTQIDGLTPPQGTAAINHNNKTYSGVSCEGFWLGFKFSVSETQTITALGAWDEGHNVDVNNEFSSCPDASNFSVPIAIYKNDVLVLEKVINASTGFVIGSSRYIKIDDFVLTPGDEYFIIGNYEGSSKFGYFDSNLVSSNYDSRITPLTVTSSPLFSKNTNGDGTFPSNLTTLPDNQWSDQYFHVNFLLKN